MLELITILLQEGLFFLGYITGRSEFPKQLARAEEEALIARMLEDDEDARQLLITHNLRLVSHIARKYTVPGYGPDDLISIGVIGLIKAVNSYKATSGTALGTYAARCIENEILMTLRASRKYRGDVSLQDSVGTDGEGNDITYMDILGTEPDEIENAVIRRVTLERVQQVLTSLPPRERLVLEMRYGLTDGKQHPQHEVAKVLGISRSYVSRVEKKAIELLRDAIEG
jgi:RNA polymerase sporulation-specific sigma factor